MTDPITITHPKLAAQWHPTRNKSLDINIITAGSSKRPWWLHKKCGYEWDAYVLNRSREVDVENCPACSGRVLFVGISDLGTTHLSLSGQWHPTLNGDLRPTDVRASDKTEAFWLHKVCGYEWREAINVRAGQKLECLACDGKRAVVGISALSTTHPAIAAEMLPELNKGLTANEVCAGWTTRVEWCCSECQHVWNTEVRVRTRGSGCPACAGNAVVPERTSLAVKNPKLAAELHPTLNGDITAYNIMPNYTKPVIWQCLINPIHVWPQTPNSRNSNNLGCPGCSGQMVFAGDKDLGTTHPIIAGEWHPTKNGDLTPQQVGKGHSEQVWWRGRDCRHDWHDTVSHRVAGRGCAVCAGQQIHVGITDLGSTHPDVAITLHPTRNNGITAQELHANKKEHYWWQCSKCGHEWYQRVFLRVQGKGCEICREKPYSSVAENEIAAWVESMGYVVQRGNRVVLGDRQEIDIYIPALRFGIEYNGLWYHSTLGGKDPDYHHSKWQRAQQAGITLVQVWEDDWQNNATAIKERLSEQLLLTASGNASQVVAVVFLEKHLGLLWGLSVIEVKNDLGLDAVMRTAGYEMLEDLPATSAYVNRIGRIFERQLEDAGLSNLIWDAGHTRYKLLAS